MTPQPQQQIYSVGIKSPKEIERDEELQRAYTRGYEDGAASHTTPPPICDRCKTDQEPFCIGCERLIPHDAAITAQAREKVLENICKNCGAKEYGSCVGTDCPVGAYKQSLRTGGDPR
jgi:predicted Fe-S protein YdhL (DUF1289 family)